MRNQSRPFLTSVLYVGILLVLFTASISAQQEVLPRPKTEAYPDPYKLMTVEEIVSDQGMEWRVFCNSDHAPIWEDIGNSLPPSHECDYLEQFQVLARNEGYIYVRSLERNPVEGWANMKNFILSQKGIKSSSTRVFYKAFLRLRLESEEDTSFDKDVFRFRTGPGNGTDDPTFFDSEECYAIDSNLLDDRKNCYAFLTDEESIDRVGGLFFYVYGIYFEPRVKLTKQSLSQLQELGMPKRIVNILDKIQDSMFSKNDLLEKIEEELGDITLSEEHKEWIMTQAILNQEEVDYTKKEFHDANYFLIGERAS